MIVRFSGIFCALALSVGLLAEVISAQTIRFDTNVGSFDMVLNPTGNSNLQGHVDNILNYVNAQRYDRTLINRAVTGFVLQMGGFQAGSLMLDENATVSDFFNTNPSVSASSAVVVDSDGDGAVDFDTTGLSNTTGTVSLALGSDQNGTTLVNSGTSSFFINLTNNDGSGTDNNLDASGFIPFAEIRNMETINLIMALSQRNLLANATVNNIPVIEGERMIFIERAYEVDSETLSETPGFIPTSASSALSTSVSIPEPASLMTALGALMFLAAGRRRLLA